MRGESGGGRVLVVVLAGLLAGGCTLPRTLPTSAYLMVHEDGFPVTPEAPGRPLDPEDFDRLYVTPILAGIDAYVRDFDAAGERPRLILFIHGGLVRFRSSLGTVRRYLDEQREYAGLRTAHMVFLNWNSSLWSSVADDLVSVRRGERDALEGAVTAPFVTAARLGSAGLQAPRAWWYSGENAVDGIRQTKGGDVCNAPPEEAPPKFSWDVYGYVTYWAFLVPRLLTVPFIQGLGTPAWDMMKRRADLTVAPYPEIRRAGTTREGALRVFMEALQRRVPAPGKWRADGKLYDLGIVIAGHSLGTMVVNRLLVHFPGIHYHRIVYVGAAASLTSIQTAVEPYLLRHPESRFWNFSLSETDEARQIYGPDLYERGSLLVWIDNLFERVDTLGHRTFGREKNLRKYYRVPSDLADQMFLVVFDGQGPNDPRRHGDFSHPNVFDRIVRIVESERCPKPFPERFEQRR